MSIEATEASSTTEQQRSLITSVIVVGLFGRYTYRLHAPSSEDGRVLLLHGENGAGKTTVLRLLWHLLSAADNKGHRTFLARTPFESLEVALSDGTRIKVKKLRGLVGNFQIRVERPHAEDIEVSYPVADESLRVMGHGVQWEADYGQPSFWDEREGRGSYQHFGAWIETPSGRMRQVVLNEEPDPFLTFLSMQGIVPIMLSDDRMLHSDDPELERWRERVNSAQGVNELNDRADRVSAELRVTLRRVTDWFRRLTIGGQNSGFEGANTIYRNVLLRLTSRAVSPIDEDSHEDIRETLKALGTESLKFEEFGLVPHFAADEFLVLLEDVGDEGLARDILAPYLATLRTRYAALEHPERMLRALVYVANEFLTDKRVSFNPQDGLTILTHDGTVLEPEMLSSGERQLCTLLCTTILAGRDSRLFIIDEPELSLGVNWQRQVIATLLRLTKGTSLQFILATHSIEIISGQPESIVRLIPEPYEPSAV